MEDGRTAEGLNSFVTFGFFVIFTQKEALDGESKDQWLEP
jgi:hypothetical protein